jgi:hypothetical protein
LGELYNAEGDIESAFKILDHCSFNMGYSNPTLIRHRQILQETIIAIANEKAAAIAAEKQREEDARRYERKRFWWIVSIGVALGLMLLYYQFREVIRRFRRRESVT